MRAAGADSPGDSPRRPLRAELCLWPQGCGGRLASRAPLGEPFATPSSPVLHPPPRARWHSRRGVAERQLSCSHFLIVVFEASGSCAEPFVVPAPRLLGGVGGRAMREARLRAGAGRAPSAAARLVRRRFGSAGRRPLSPRALAMSKRSSQLSSWSGWRPRSPLP